MTTTEKKKYLFAKLPPILQDFGFFLFKGKLWCYRPEQQMVYCIDCTFTQWGTLNEIDIGFGSFCAPIKKGGSKQELYLGDMIDLCRYIRIKQGVSVYAMYGDSADGIFVEQVNALLPYLNAELERIFALPYQTDILGQIRMLLDMKAETQEIIPLDLFFYQHRLGNTEAAKELLKRRIASCEQIIQTIRSEKDELAQDHFEELMESYSRMIAEANEYSKRMDSNDPLLSKMIDERIKESAALCEEFFRHGRKKATP
ncbi:MAG: hypothetical protein IKK75_12100 [Clostridia bacterium]|nr:hypothetical protein [Clostridia bacterium]